MSLISCENAALSYEGKTIVSQLNFTVSQGDYLCIVGENGSGKSTLMRALLGLKSVSSGKITFGEGMSKRDIGYLPQQTAVQRDFPASVWEVVLSGCLGRTGLRPFYSKADKERAKNALEKLGVGDLKKRCYRELSGGQQQRVLLARALCAASRLLILDEPVAGLDPRVTSDLYSLIYKLNKEDGMTVIMVSHDILQATSYASHILHIGSTPLFFGKTEDYLKTGVGKLFTGEAPEGKGDGEK